MSRKWVGIILGAVLLVTVVGVYISLESLATERKSAHESDQGSASATGVKPNKPTDDW